MIFIGQEHLLVQNNSYEITMNGYQARDKQNEKRNFQSPAMGKLPQRYGQVGMFTKLST